MTSTIKKRFHIKMPGAFTILFFLTIVAVMLTWFVPAGSYAKMQYSSNHLQVTSPTGIKSSLPATQETLNKLHVKIDIAQFKSGAISKPVSIPNTYKRLKQHPASVLSIFTSMVNGTIEAVDIMIFILVLGGLIGIVKASGSFEAGLMALTKKTKGHEFALVFLVAVLLLLGGTLCGIEEEAVAFYPILVPVFIAMGYDSIVCVGAIFLASSVGTTFSTINPFSVVIASNAAGTNFTQGLVGRVVGLIIAGCFVLWYLYRYARKVQQNPKFSYSYDDHDSFNKMWSVSSENATDLTFDAKKKLILILFALAFPIMIWGVMAEGWAFPDMASSFLIIAVIIMFITCFGKHGLGEKGVVDAFVSGSSSLVGVSLIIGLARGINLVLNNGYISDTILHASTQVVSHMSGPLFIVVMMFVFFVLGFIVPSSSGLAVLAMPILAPLADTVNIPRYTVVTAYQFGQYAMLFLAPTGLVMATLQMLDMKYSHWIRFVWPVVVFVLVFGGGLLVAEVLLS
ncbi:Arginine-ornithine antiporter ArcD [Furfurilactobacillus rossiae]|uniref:YfcC family protein n=1 Tax=Furfurilactobacillus rossiae TaxID=231049 RepID=UPI0015BEF7DC|nr:YfcC family protein [Furfurilactobacillus rossiae]MCF6166609.1 YfcC family protein [Furfurilactobacillus rossiae]QLE64355.1 Arginine-ornithine antiporter ArcD [Furfurilactobacillus rossiae]